MGSRAPQGWSQAPQGGEPGSSGRGEPGSPPEEPGSTPGSRGARLRFGLLAGSWARATWPDWLCRICSPQPPYPPSKAHFPPPVGVVREVNKSGTADTALKTRLPSIYSGAPHRLRTGSTRGAGLPPEGSRPKFLGDCTPPPRPAAFGRDRSVLCCRGERCDARARAEHAGHADCVLSREECAARVCAAPAGCSAHASSRCATITTLGPTGSAIGTATAATRWRRCPPFLPPAAPPARPDRRPRRGPTTS